MRKPGLKRMGVYPLSERGLNALNVFFPCAMFFFVITMILMCVLL